MSGSNPVLPMESDNHTNTSKKINIVISTAKIRSICSPIASALVFVILIIFLVTSSIYNIVILTRIQGSGKAVFQMEACDCKVVPTKSYFESMPYIEITQDALSEFQLDFKIREYGTRYVVVRFSGEGRSSEKIIDVKIGLQRHTESTIESYNSTIASGDYSMCESMAGEWKVYRIKINFRQRSFELLSLSTGVLLVKFDWDSWPTLPSAMSNIKYYAFEPDYLGFDVASNCTIGYNFGKIVHDVVNCESKREVKSQFFCRAVE